MVFLILGLVLCIAGFLFLGGGAVVFLIGYNGAAQYQTLLGQISYHISQEAQNQYNTYMLMEMAGGAVGVISFMIGGLLVGLFGLIAPNSAQQTSPTTIQTQLKTER
jgi:hypothetical protein